MHKEYFYATVVGMDVSVIIVNYNTKDLLRNCLKSIYEHTQGITFEVIVSDNGSTDNSKEMLKKYYPQVILIENNDNLGFGSANNRGRAVSQGKYVFYLNSDTILLNNAIKLFYDYWENSEDKESIGALGCNLMDENMNVSHSSADFPDCNSVLWNLIKANYGMLKFCCFSLVGKKYCLPLKEPEIKKNGEVGYIVGADLFLKNDENASFDEKIFLYVEDVDLQLKLSKMGKKRLLIEEPRILHLGGKSSPQKETFPFPSITSFSSRCNNISRIYYFRKHGSPTKAFFIKLLTITLWLNPLVFKYTRQSMWDLIRR